MGPVDQIKQKLDLVEYIRQHVQLTKSGANWKGLCPFHKEKTPSFYVSPVKQFWYCFGCHQGGDLFKFAMEIEHLEFPEALKLLAEKAGVEMRKEDPQLRSRKNRLLDALSRAAEFYQKNLAKDSEPYAYVKERGLSDETIQEFKLGFAPAGWRNLYDHLAASGFTPDEMEGAGLVVRQQNSTEGAPSGYYDRFRSRIMFPITDTNSRVIGFSGRIFGNLPEAEDAGGKYINTPETLLFHKGETLYGISHTRQEIRKAGYAVLVEGQMDFLMAWQDGIKNAVAASGTALTEMQLQALQRLCEELVLAFDMDAAGQEATDRSIAKAQRIGFSVKIATLPAGKDVADYAKFFPGKLTEILSRTQSAMDYFFQKAFEGRGAASLDEKKVIIRYLLPRIKTFASLVDQAYWLQELSRRVRIDEQALKDELNRMQPIDMDTISGETAGSSLQPSGVLPEKTRLDMLVERALCLVLDEPERAALLGEYAGSFPPRIQGIIQKLAARELAIPSLADAIGADFFNYLQLRADYEKTMLGDRDPAEELVLTLWELKRERLRIALREVSVAIQEAEFAKNEERVKALTQEFHRLAAELAKEPEEVPVN